MVWATTMPEAERSSPRRCAAMLLRECCHCEIRSWLASARIAVGGSGNRSLDDAREDSAGRAIPARTRSRAVRLESSGRTNNSALVDLDRGGSARTRSCSPVDCSCPAEITKNSSSQRSILFGTWLDDALLADGNPADCKRIEYEQTPSVRRASSKPQPRPRLGCAGRT